MVYSIILDRNLDRGTLGVRIFDRDRGVYAEDGVSGIFYDDVANYSNVSDEDGNLRYSFIPSCSYSVGGHNWIGGSYGDLFYEDKNSSSKSFSVRGWLNDSLLEPILDFNVSDVVLIRDELRSECGDLVPSASSSFEILDSLNNSYLCIDVNNEGDGHYNCSWDSSAVNEGYYSVRINSSATNYNSNSTYYKDVFFLNNQNPNAVGLNNFPLYGGWGESFDYSVNISDAEGDDVTCSLWVNTTGVWVKKKTMTNSAPYFCELSVDDYSSSDIGLYFYKFQLNDSFNEVNTSDQLGILVNGTIEEDDVRVIHLSGDNSVVSRVGSNVTRLGVRLEDLDKGGYVAGENMNFAVNYSSIWNVVNIGVTDADGNVSYDWNPGCDVGVGFHDWVGNYSGSFEYKGDSSSVFSLMVRGLLNVGVDSPVSGVFH